jgi:alpha-1,2-rhamnosyltransferase
MDHFRLGSDLNKVQDGAVRSSLREFLQAPRVYASVGSIEPKKNHAALLDAFEEAWAGGSDARLIVVGRRTPECAAVIARMDRHVQQAPWRAMLVDDASDAELAYVYGNCRAVVLPSSFEGFGLPLVEARTRGCPVFANKLAAFRELADAGVEWFDSQRPSTLTRLLLEDAAGRLPLGREAMAPFGWQESARQCLARVDALLAAVGRAHGSPNPLPLRGCEP